MINVRRDKVQTSGPAWTGQCELDLIPSSPDPQIIGGTRLHLSILTPHGYVWRRETVKLVFRILM